MKKMQLFSLVLLAAMLGAGAASAGGTFLLGGGLAFPTGDLNDVVTTDGWEKGLAFDGTALFEMNPTLSVGLNLGYRQLTLKEDNFLGWDSYDGGDLGFLNACGEIRMHTGAMDKARLWVNLGLGAYGISRSDLTVSDGVDSQTFVFESETRVGGYAGLGTAMPVGTTMGLGLEGKYHLILEDMGGYTFSCFEMKAVFMFTM